MKPEDALRDLVAVIYQDCFGAYGSGDGHSYSGQYEHEIQAFLRALREDGTREEDNRDHHQDEG